MELDDILSENEPDAPAEPVETPTEAQGEPIERPQSRHKQHMAKEYAAQGRDPATGQFVPKDAPKDEPTPVEAAPTPVEPVVEPPKPPVQEMTEKEKAFLRGMQEERQKRQELERRLAALEKPAEPPPTLWQDPDTWQNTAERRMQEIAVTTKLNTAEMIARSRHADYDEAIAVYADMVRSNPALHVQCVNSPDPAEYAYRLGVQQKMLQDVGDLGQYRAKIEADAYAKAKAEFEAQSKAKEEQRRKEREALPGSLSSAPGVRQNAVTWSGPTSLEDVLK